MMERSPDTMQVTVDLSSRFFIGDALRELFIRLKLR